MGRTWKCVLNKSCWIWRTFVAKPEDLRFLHCNSASNFPFVLRLLVFWDCNDISFQREIVCNSPVALEDTWGVFRLLHFLRLLMWHLFTIAGNAATEIFRFCLRAQARRAASTSSLCDCDVFKDVLQSSMPRLHSFGKGKVFNCDLHTLPFALGDANKHGPAIVIFSTSATVSSIAWSIVSSFLHNCMPNGFCFLSSVSELVFEARIVSLHSNKFATAIKTVSRAAWESFAKQIESKVCVVYFN